MRATKATPSSPKPHARGGFYIIYAVLFVLSLGLACAFYLQQGYRRSSTLGHTHAKAQLELYAKSVREAVALCLETHGFDTCQIQRFSFAQGYELRASLTRYSPHIILLDIHASVLHPSSTNILRLSRRYVFYLKNP